MCFLLSHVSLLFYSFSVFLLQLLVLIGRWGNRSARSLEKGMKKKKKVLLNPSPQSSKCVPTPSRIANKKKTLSSRQLVAFRFVVPFRLFPLALLCPSATENGHERKNATSLF